MAWCAATFISEYLTRFWFIFTGPLDIEEHANESGEFRISIESVIKSAAAELKQLDVNIL